MELRDRFVRAWGLQSFEPHGSCTVKFDPSYTLAQPAVTYCCPWPSLLLNGRLAYTTCDQCHGVQERQEGRQPTHLASQRGAATAPGKGLHTRMKRRLGAPELSSQRSRIHCRLHS